MSGPLFVYCQTMETHIEQVKFPIFKFYNMLFLIALRKLFLKDDFYEGALSL